MELYKILNDLNHFKIKSIAVNSKYVAYMHENFKMTICSLNGKLKKIIKDKICCIAMNEKYIVSGCDEDGVYQAKIWDINEIINSEGVAVNKNSLSPKVIKHIYPLKSVAIQGNKIVTLTSDTKEPIKIWDFKGDLKQTIQTFLTVNCIATYKNLIAYVSANKELSIWDMEEKEIQYKVDIDYPRNSIAMNKNCVAIAYSKYVSDTFKKYIKTWRKNKYGNLDSKKDLIDADFVVMNDNYIVTASNVIKNHGTSLEGKIHLFDAEQKQIDTKSLNIDSQITCIDMHLNNIVIARKEGSANKIEIWKIEDGATENSGSGSKFKYLLKY